MQERAGAHGVDLGLIATLKNGTAETLRRRGIWGLERRGHDGDFHSMRVEELRWGTGMRLIAALTGSTGGVG